MSILNGVLEAAKAAKLLSREGFLKQIEKWWAVAQLDKAHSQFVVGIAKQIQANKDRYKRVERLTGVPWFFIGVIHQKECSLNFNKVLHNGELLTDVNARGTRLVPKGRGKGKNWTWEQAAIDALLYDKMDKKDFSTVPKMIDGAERYNGLGFRNRGVPSIYCWSHTNISTEKGKYVSDGKWDSSAPSKNPGVAAMFLGLIILGENLGTGISKPIGEPSEIDKVTDDSSAVLKDLASKAGVLAPMERMLEFAKTIDFNKGPNYWGVIDFSKHSSKKRSYIFDVKNKTYKEYLVSHGSGSDKNNDGYADKFSNTEDSHMSSLGIYQCGKTYQGKHGLSLKLKGLEASNSNAEARAIVIHGADYVNGNHVGRSWGCPAYEMRHIKEVISQLEGGSLLIVVA